MSCVKCGKSKVDHQQIFLTQDKYCTVCNHIYKDRPRTKSIFEFTIIKEGKYDHYSIRDRPYTNLEKAIEPFRKHERMMNMQYQFHKYWDNRNRKIEEFL